MSQVTHQSNSLSSSSAGSSSGYSQAGRPLQISTPLADNVLLITGFNGSEGISRLFRFHLTLAAADPTLVDFDKLLGGSISVRLAQPDGGIRHFNGVCSMLAQGARQTGFTGFDMEIVPMFWRLTQQVESRIFQHLSVPEILDKILADVPHTLQLSQTYHPREYCVQYRETHYNFACRLMEEEGIYFYFVHSAVKHQMMISDEPTFPPIEPDRLIYQQADASVDDATRITHWEKSQRVQSGAVTLRDHTFQIPHDPLEHASNIQDRVRVGSVMHSPSAGQASSMEIHDWPGEFSRRFDGVDRNGVLTGPPELSKIPPDGRRTVTIRMQEIACATIQITGTSNCRRLASGHSFKVKEVPVIPYKGSSTVDGSYVATAVDHFCEAAIEYRSGDSSGRLYSNRFVCIPDGLPYRPPRITPRPVIPGPQTAVVVKGPGGDEIFTDPYGRVKVKFHWDRSGEANPDSSCWIRVAHPSSGGVWGMHYVPRGDQEVVVQFEEGDPDRPIIIGSVYNPQTMPPFDLPSRKMVSGFRSNTYPGGGGMNEISVDDTKSNELLYMHAQYDKRVVVNHDRNESIGNDHVESIGNDKQLKVAQNHTEAVGANHVWSIVADQSISIGGNQTRTIAGNKQTGVVGNQVEEVLMSSNELVGMAKTITVGGAYTLTVGAAMNVFVGSTSMEEVGQTKQVVVGEKLSLVCGAGSITIESNGKITVSGTEFVFVATGHVQITGKIIDLN